METMEGEREELEDMEVSDSAGDSGGDKEHSLCEDLKLRSRGVSWGGGRNILFRLGAVCSIGGGLGLEWAGGGEGEELGLMVREGYRRLVSSDPRSGLTGAEAVARDISANCLRPLRSLSEGCEGGEGGK